MGLWVFHDTHAGTTAGRLKPYLDRPVGYGRTISGISICSWCSFVWAHVAANLRYYTCTHALTHMLANTCQVNMQQDGVPLHIVTQHVKPHCEVAAVWFADRQDDIT